MSESDVALLDRWIAGDVAAGNALFERYFEPLYRFFNHKTSGDIDDLVQETFMACLKGRDSFRRESSFRTYLFAIARKGLYRHWARQHAGVGNVAVEDMSLASLSTSVGSRLIRSQERARLLAALQTLPMDDQVLLELFYWQDFNREQLAEIYEVEPATIGSRLFRLRQLLMERLTLEDTGTLDAWVRSLGQDAPPST